MGNPCDNCTSVFNPRQADCNEDGQGDSCDTNSDCDGDGVSDAADNCPVVSNPLQEDSDDDQAGDACDVCPFDPDDDIDGDGLCADVDA